MEFVCNELAVGVEIRIAETLVAKIWIIFGHAKRTLHKRCLYERQIRVEGAKRSVWNIYLLFFIKAWMRLASVSG